jgi:hypothetical protein
METLNAYFGSRQHIPVSRVWLEKMNIQVNDSKPNVVESSVKPTAGTDTVEVKLSD